MFSKLFKSAKSYIVSQNDISTIFEAGPSLENAMVTPRATHVVNSTEKQLTANDSINLRVSTSSGKKRKGRSQPEAISEDEEFVTPSSKKRRVLPVRAKNVKTPQKFKDTRPVVEIPARKSTPEIEVVEEDRELVRSEVSELKLAVTTPAKHRRFASEELEQEIFSTARQEFSPQKRGQYQTLEISSEEINEESEESDEEGPEAIGIQEAAKSIQLKEKEAAQILKEQQSAIRKKRRERYDVLKNRSESRKNPKTELPAKHELVVSEVDVEDKYEINPVVLDNRTDQILMHIDEQPPQRKRMALDLHRDSLPDLLPAEYLEEPRSKDLALHEVGLTKRSKPKKTKFRDLVEKAPKDKRIGSTTYRVTKVPSINLAPKSAYQARLIKESWLQGRSGNALHTNRKSVSKGFFRK